MTWRGTAWHGAASVRRSRRLLLASRLLPLPLRGLQLQRQAVDFHKRRAPCAVGACVHATCMQHACWRVLHVFNVPGGPPHTQRHTRGKTAYSRRSARPARVGADAVAPAGFAATEGCAGAAYAMTLLLPPTAVLAGRQPHAHCRHPNQQVMMRLHPAPWHLLLLVALHRTTTRGTGRSAPLARVPPCRQRKTSKPPCRLPALSAGWDQWEAVPLPPPPKKKQRQCQHAMGRPCHA